MRHHHHGKVSLAACRHHLRTALRHGITFFSMATFKWHMVLDLPVWKAEVEEGPTAMLDAEHLKLVLNHSGQIQVQ